jgi:hypothetical protein
MFKFLNKMDSLLDSFFHYNPEFYWKQPADLVFPSFGPSAENAASLIKATVQEVVQAIGAQAEGWQNKPLTLSPEQLVDLGLPMFVVSQEAALAQPLVVAGAQDAALPEALTSQEPIGGENKPYTLSPEQLAELGLPVIEPSQEAAPGQPEGGQNKPYTLSTEQEIDLGVLAVTDLAPNLWNGNGDPAQISVCFFDLLTDPNVPQNVNPLSQIEGGGDVVTLDSFAPTVCVESWGDACPVYSVGADLARGLQDMADAFFYTSNAAY